MSKVINQKSRLFTLLAAGKNITVAQANAKGIRNVSAVVSSLRDEGADIFTNRVKDAKTGKYVVAYRFAS